MRSLLITFSVLLAVVFSNNVKADDSPKRSPELDVLARYLGTWDVHVTVKPAGGEKTNLEVVSRRRWTLGGTFLQIEDANNLNDPQAREFQMLWTYDPVAKNYPAVLMDGPHRAELTGTWGAKTTTMYWTGKSSDGSTSQGKHRFIGKDRAEASGVFKDADGNVVMEISWPQTRRKVKVAASANAASSVTKPEPPVKQTVKAEQVSLDDLFPEDRILDVQINVAQKDWDTIRHQRRNLFEVLGEQRQSGPIDHAYTYVDASVTIDGVKFPQVGIRKKGFIGSQNSTRPSLKIKLNHVDRKGGIDGLTNLTFNNNKQDTSQISQFMGYRLFNAAGSAAPRCAFAKITVNGKSLGIYSHVESMRRPLFKRAYGNDRGTLYEGTVVDFYEDWDAAFEEKWGKDKPGRKKIVALIKALQQEDDDEIEQAIGRHVDLDSFYTFWAVEGLIGFWDGYSANRNNFFVYLNPETDKFHFLPWGLDCGFEKTDKLNRAPGLPISVKTRGLIAHRLYQLESGRARYRETLLALLDEHWDEKALLAETERIETLLKPHLFPSQQRTFATMERTRGFIRNRRKDILAEIADGMPLWTKKPEPPPIIGKDSMPGLDPNSIWAAAKRGDIEAIKKHLANKVDVNAQDKSGTTPLAMATISGQLETARFLLDHGADINAKNKRNDSVLHGVAFLGRTDVVQLLIDRKINLNPRNNENSTPLDNAAAPWSEEIQGIVQFIGGILQLKLDMEEVKQGRSEVADLLRKHGAKHGAQLSGGRLWPLAKLGDIAGLELELKKKDIKINGHDDKGITPLSWAALAGQEKAAALLIKHGADINARNRDGSTPLHSAAFLGRTAIVKLLIKNKADVAAKNQRRQTPLASVTPAWNEQTQGIVQFIARVLQIKVDIEKVKAGRIEVAALLGQHSEDSPK